MFLAIHRSNFLPGIKEGLANLKKAAQSMIAAFAEDFSIDAKINIDEEAAGEQFEALKGTAKALESALDIKADIDTDDLKKADEALKNINKEVADSDKKLKLTVKADTRELTNAEKKLDALNNVAADTQEALEIEIDIDTTELETAEKELKEISDTASKAAEKMKIKEKVDIDTSEATAKLKILEEAAGKLGDLLKKAVIGIGASVGIAAKGILNVGMSFESSMAEVKAISRASTEDFQRLSDTAREMGATTAYTAAEAADALKYLALAGYDTEKSIAAIPIVLQTAQASGMELAQTSDLITDGMAALGLGTEHLQMFADKLTKTSQITNTEIQQMGEAILGVGTNARLLKGGTTELNTILGILANAGTKGAEAGTALRNILISLTQPTAEAAKYMKKYGIDVVDAAGNLRSFDDIFFEIKQSMADLGDAQKSMIMGELFNKADISEATLLLEASGDEFARITNEIIKSKGAAKQYAETMVDTLKGDVDSAMSALEGVGELIYTKFLPPLREAMQFAAEAFERLGNEIKSGKLDEAIQRIADAAGKLLNGIIDFLTNHMGDIMNAISWVLEHIGLLTDAVFGLKAAMLAFKLTGNIALSAIVAGVVMLIGYLVDLYNSSDEAKAGFINFGIGAMNVLKGIGNFFITIIRTALEAYNAVAKLLNWQQAKLPKYLEYDEFITAEDLKRNIKEKEEVLDEELGMYEEFYDQEALIRGINLNNLTEDTETEEEIFARLRKDLEFQRDMDIISTQQFYEKLGALRDVYLTENSDEWRSVTVEIYRYNKKLQEELIKSFEKTRDEIRKTYEEIAKSTTRNIDKIPG